MTSYILGEQLCNETCTEASINDVRKLGGGGEGSICMGNHRRILQNHAGNLTRQVSNLFQDLWNRSINLRGEGRVQNPFGTRWTDEEMGKQKGKQTYRQDMTGATRNLVFRGSRE